MKNGDLNDFCKGLVDGYARVAKAGGEAERDRLLPLFAAIYRAFDMAIENNAARVPTPLMLAIERARTVTGNVVTAPSLAPRENEPGYGGDIGLSTFGTPLKAGQ